MNRSLHRYRLAALAPLMILLSACGGGGGSGGSGSTPSPPTGQQPPAPTFTATSGVAEKGPLVKGAIVTAFELDANLAPTGKQYVYQVSSDLGTFEPATTFGSKYVALSAIGNYFDEVQGGTSSGTVTLKSYNDLSVSGVLNVNLLTTLAYERIKYLIVNSGATFAAAQSQAEREVLAALKVPAGDYGSFSSFSLQEHGDGDYILASVSSLFTQGNEPGALNALIAKIQSDIAGDGRLDDIATQISLAQAARQLNAAAVAANLNSRYAFAGVTFDAKKLTDWLDRDGSGIVGRFKFDVPDAAPSSVFTLPAYVVDGLAGSSLSVVGGQFAVNGTAATVAATLKKGDVLTVSPPSGPFPNGKVDVSLVVQGAAVARVSFISGLSSLAIAPAVPSVAKGLTKQLAVSGTFSDTSILDLTNNVTWSTSSSAVATVDTFGVVRGRGVGTATITATSGSVSTTVDFTVTAAALQSIVITPNPLFSRVTGTSRPKVTGTYSDDTTADIASLVTWHSADPQVATVHAASGLITGVALGSTDISAEVGQLSSTARLTVVSGMWTLSGELEVGRHQHTATLLPNGKVLVAGGGGYEHIDEGPLNDSNYTRSEIYDPATETWSLAAQVAKATFYTTTLLVDGKPLMIAGTSGSSPNKVSAYDAVTDTWVARADMPGGRLAFTTTLLQDGTVLIAGGAGTPAGSVLSTSLRYDPVANTWSSAADLPEARTQHIATRMNDGRVLVYGGWRAPGLGPASTPVIYDPVANSWSSAAQPSRSRVDGYAATLLADGRFLVTGGYSGIPGPTVTSAEIYNPSDNTWSLAASMLTARVGHTATLLPNGKVLVAGGVPSDSNYLATTELYDPVTNTWSAGDSLTVPRTEHTTTVLQDNKILIIGGMGPGTGYVRLKSTELYW